MARRPLRPRIGITACAINSFRDFQCNRPRTRSSSAIRCGVVYKYARARHGIRAQDILGCPLPGRVVRQTCICTIDMLNEEQKEMRGAAGHKMEPRRVALGCVAGGGVLAAVMLLLAVTAIAAGMITTNAEGQFDLTPWLALEVAGGAVASVLAGRVCRRVARCNQGPAALAVIVFCAALVEAVELFRQATAGRVEAAWWLLAAAPWVAGGGVLFGGLRASSWHAMVARFVRTQVLMKAPRYAVVVFTIGVSSLLALYALPGLATETEKQVVATALVMDFTLSLPVMVYVLLVRTGRLPWMVLLPTFVAGYTLAALTIPSQHHAGLDAVGWLAVPAELAVVIYLVLTTRKAFRQAGDDEGDFATRLRATAREVLAKRTAADIITTEVSILYYAFRCRPAASLRPGEYSVHRESGYGLMLVGLGMVLIAETLAVHFVVTLWSNLAAWVLSGLSVYALVWLLGDYRAFSARPIRITARQLQLRLGLRWEANIPLSSIVRVEPIVGSHGKAERGVLHAALVGSPNVRLELDRVITVTAMYGLEKSVQSLCIRVDRAGDFIRELAQFVEARDDGECVAACAVTPTGSPAGMP